MSTQVCLSRHVCAKEYLDHICLKKVDVGTADITHWFVDVSGILGEAKNNHTILRLPKC